VAAALAYALARARVHRGRQVLALLGVVAAAAMVGASVTIAHSLSGGFARTSQRAGLPDILSTFSPLQRGRVAGAVSRLANVRAVSYLLQEPGVHVTAGGNYEGHAKLFGVGSGRHGYAIVSGHDIDGPGQAVVEAGFARAWHLHVGDRIGVQFRLGEELRVVGIAVPPDTVAFPLTNGPRVYAGYEDARRIDGVAPGVVNGVDLWLVDPRLVDVTLAQARSASLDVEGLQFVTRTGLHLLIGRAAGIVIAVVVAFSLIALLVACVMLSASAAAEVQRRLTALGLLRAVGVSARTLVAAAAVEAAVFALPAAALGVTVGWLAVRGPADRLLASLNELPPGSSLALLLVASTLGLTLLVVAATCWPAWRATRRPTVEVLRGGDVGRGGRRLRLPGVLSLLGVRLVLARPARAAATVAVVGFAVSVVLTILAIATVLENLNRQPLSVGKRYQLLVNAPPSDLARITRLPQVAAATPFYSVEVADSFALDEPFTLDAFGAPPPGYEAPPLSEGHLVRSADEAEVGLGLAQALGLHPGGVLAAQLPNGREVRFRVAGIVQALEDQGRIAYVEAARLRAAEPGLGGQIAVKLRPGASASAVTEAVARSGESTTDAGGIAGQSVQGWAARSSGFIDILVALLRSVAVLNACVCLYAVGQALALTAQERRRALAVVRAQGAGRLHLFAVFGVAAAFLVLLAWGLAALLERWAVAPGVAHLAASYVVLALGAGGQLLAYTLAGLLAGAALVAAVLVRVVVHQPVVAGLRED
jgi:ABC-type lipoprotein release transport system permease subunit